MSDKHEPILTDVKAQRIYALAKLCEYGFPILYRMPSGDPAVQSVKRAIAKAEGSI